MTDSKPKQEILKQRAQKLAQKITTVSQVEQLQVIVFYLGSEKYAIETSYIREVYPLKEITSLPGLPPFVKGIMNVRRRILSVIDLKYFLDITTENKDLVTKVLILEHKTMEFAILTDGIEGIKTIPIPEIQNSLPTLTGIKQEFLKGLTTDQLVILDGKRLLESQHFIIQDNT